MNHYTHTIFQSPKIAFTQNGSEYRSARCVKAIRKGDLLLVEHCFTGTETDSYHMVRNCPLIYNLMLPRKSTWIPEMMRDDVSTDLQRNMLRKLKENFECDQGTYVIGCDVMRFNRSENRNAFMTTSTIELRGGVDTIPVTILFVFATEDVAYNEQVCLPHHMEDDVARDISSHLPIMETIIKQHRSKAIFGQLIMNQISLHHGLFIVEDDISVTKRFSEWFERMYHMECTMERAIQWYEQTVESIVHSNAA